MWVALSLPRVTRRHCFQLKLRPPAPPIYISIYNYSHPGFLVFSPELISRAQCRVVAIVLIFGASEPRACDDFIHFFSSVRERGEEFFLSLFSACVRAGAMETEFFLSFFFRLQVLRVVNFVTLKLV